MSLLPLDMSAIVSCLSTENITVRRIGTTVDANGRSSETGTILKIKNVSVQPISGADLRRLPEGFMGTAGVSIWSATELRLRDRVKTADGEQFEVEGLSEWHRSGKYYKVICRLLVGAEVDATLAAA